MQLLICVVLEALRRGHEIHSPAALNILKKSSTALYREPIETGKV